LNSDELLQRREKPDLIRFMAFPRDEKLDLLEKIVEPMYKLKVKILSR
jgi:hypothetical protein